MKNPRPARPSGIYAADIQVFRFYPDGLVLDALVKPAPDMSDGPTIERWLRRESPPTGVHTARYSMTANHISFTTPSHLGGGIVEVRGTCHASHLILRVHPRGHPQDEQRFTPIWPAPGAHRSTVRQARPPGPRPS